MPFSATVTFEDGSTHIYDKIPDGTTSADMAPRVARDYPNKPIASLMREPGAAPTPPAAKPSPKSPGFWETIARAGNNVPQALSDTAANAGAFGQDLLQTVRNLSPEGQRGSAPALPQNGSTQALIAALKSAPAATVALAKGGVQQVRNLSPRAQQGTAPAMDTTAIQAAQEDLYKRRGIDLGPQGRPFNPQNLSADVIAHPLSAIVDVGGAALGGGGLALKGGKAAMEAVDLAAALAAARKAPGAVGGVIAAPFKAGGRVLDAGATPAAEAVRAAAIAKALAQNKRVDSLAAEVAAKKAADKPLRQVMEDVATAKANQGIGVSDVPEARSLVDELNGRLNPNGPVATTPTTGQASAYKAIIETLAPSKGPKPSLEMVQNLRRELADAAYGGTDPRGFGAISKLDKRNLVDRLHEIEKSYTEGASEPVRANWSSIPDQKALKKAETQAVVFKAQASILDELPAAEAVKKAQSIVDSYFKRGLISQTEYQEYMKLANAATDAKGKSVFRKRVAIALGALGAAQTPLGSLVLRAAVGVP